MKPMIWHPETHDTKVNQYLDRVNHAPYETIFALIAVGFLFLTAVFLIGLY